MNHRECDAKDCHCVNTYQQQDLGDVYLCMKHIDYRENGYPFEYKIHLK